MVGDVGARGRPNSREVVIAEELLVRGHPVGKADVEEGSELELSEDVVGEAFVVHGRHHIAVEEHDLLDHVKHQEGEHGNREKDWHAESIEEGDIGDGEDGRVLVVHEVDWTLIRVDILLNRGALRGLFHTGATRELAATIEASEEYAHAPVHEDLKDGVVDVEDHRSNDNVTDGAEPGRVEIGEDTIGEPEGDGLLGHVSVRHQQEESGVEELHDEGDSSDLGELLSFGLVSDPGYEHNAHSTEDIVNTDEEVGQGGRPDVHRENIVVVELADFFTFGLSVSIFEGLFCVNLVISLAHALQSSAGGLSFAGHNEIIVVDSLLLELVSVGRLNTGTVLWREDSSQVH